jgi:hypothetical protein
MRKIQVLIVLLAVFAATAAGAEEGFVPLFNGKDLEGWEVDTPGLWSVKGGMIVGKHNGLKWNDFLRTKKHYENFILKLEFRLVKGVGNSGIQFRSKPVPDSHEVEGYQADIGEKYWGALYDESRRKKVLVGPPEEVLANLKKDAWNEYVIRAEGWRIKLELNGIQTVDFLETDTHIPRTGFIALQVHSGPGIEVQFRNLRIRELPPGD